MSEIDPMVAKFGGTSMAAPGLVAGVIEQHPEYTRVVVSAPSGMTRQLRQLASLGEDSIRAEGIKDDVIDRFDELYNDLDTGDRRKLRQLTHDQLHPVLDEPSEAYYASRGEYLSAAHFASMLGVPAALDTQIVFRMDGTVDRNQTAMNIRTHDMFHPGLHIVPGFFGHGGRARGPWSNPAVFLLDEGGSDRTGALYAHALGRNYDNWSDQDGIFSADPRRVAGAVLLSSVTRDETREGAHGGTKILQGDTIVDLNGSDAVVTVRNTFNPKAPGTKVTPVLEGNRDRPIIAVSSRNDLVEVQVRDFGMRDLVGYGEEVLKALASTGLAFEHFPASQDSFGITIHANTGDKGLESFVDFVSKHRLSSQGKVTARERGVVYAVGEGMRDQLEQQKATTRLLQLATSMNVSVVPVSNGESPSVALLTDRDNTDELMRAIHETEVES